jgi:hypothetical protein
MLPYKVSDLIIYSFGFYTISKKFPKKNFQKKSNFEKSSWSFLNPYILAPFITQRLSKNSIKNINISKKKFFFPY